MRELNSTEQQAMCHAINQAQFNIDRIFFNLSMSCKRFNFQEMEDQLNQIKILTEQVRNTMYDLRNLQIVEEQINND